VPCLLHRTMPHQRERNAIRSSDGIAAAPAAPPSSSSSSSTRRQQRYAAKLAFDGTTYRGFQSQPHRNTIQDQIESRLFGLLRRPIRIEAWGRTDTGVHATGAVVSVDLHEEEVTRFASAMMAGTKKKGRLTAGRTSYGDEEEVEEEDSSPTAEEEKEVAKAAARFLCSVLREFVCDAGGRDVPGGCDSRRGSIVARSVVPVPPDFDARYSARWKRYAYYVVGGGGAALPFAWGRHSWRVNKCLNHDAMIEAAYMMSDGERNFEWLCVLQRGEMRNTRRRVNLRVERVNMPEMTTTIATTNGTAVGDDDDDGTPYFLRRGGDGEDDAPAIYRIHCTCDFFLYKMMRRIVGVLVAVGGGDASLEALSSCLDEYDDYYHRGDDSEDDRMQQNDGGGTTGAKKEKTKPAVPPKLLNTAPAKGLCLEHIEYDFAI